MKVLSRASGSVSSQRLMNPALLRIVAELRGELRAQHFPRVGRGGRLGGLDDDGRAHIAEDGMVVAVAPFEVG